MRTFTCRSTFLYAHISCGNIWLKAWLNGLLAEILRIVATVLDFNKEERARTGLDSDGMGWLGGFLRYAR